MIDSTSTGDGDAGSARDDATAARDALAETVRLALRRMGEPLQELGMFGGMGFLDQGRLVVAASRNGFLVRVGPDGFGPALAEPGVVPMEMRDRVMVGFVWVRTPDLGVESVGAWIVRALDYVRTLPPKVTTPKPMRNRRAAL